MLTSFAAISGISPMPSNVRYSPDFRNDLDRIWEYLALDREDLSAAEDIVDGLITVTEHLAEWLGRGTKLFLPDGSYSGDRAIGYKGYLAVYLLREDDVLVARAVHTHQDYMQILFPYL